jgi:hypothetical protein
MWVVIHKCVEAILGVSLYSYLYPKLAKTLWLSYYLLCLLFNKIGEEGRIGSAWKLRGWVQEGGGRGQGERDGPMYVHMNK